MTKPAKKSSNPTGKTKEQRLAEALRKNLRRRKTGKPAKTPASPPKS
ncbi:MAG: hypothetical protein V3V30_09680 [Parvularculaceae bacterium]